jgi:hypothetical protein
MQNEILTSIIVQQRAIVDKSFLNFNFNSKYILTLV